MSKKEQWLPTKLDRMEIYSSALQTENPIPFAISMAIINTTKKIAERLLSEPCKHISPRLRGTPICRDCLFELLREIEEGKQPHE